MATTYDFQIISDTLVPGISLVVAQNEDAFSYLTKEEEYTHLNDGSVPLVNEAIGDFISDVEHAHFCAALVWVTHKTPLMGGFDSIVHNNIGMTELPLDPHDCPGTLEYQELSEEAARRAYIIREAMMESDEWLCRRPHH